MKNILNLKLTEINELLKEKKIKPIDLVNEFEEKALSSSLNAFIILNIEAAKKRAIELEGKEVDNLFFGIPIVLKDNISTKNLKTTCASKMLEDYIPIFDANVVEKMEQKNMIIVGKTNMDEFAMGGTGETSYFGATKNPIDETLVPGGSSSGSAVAVAAGIVPFALGSDTGGSVRQPAAFCGVVGLKPTYGRVSRFGLIAFGSSLDQIGPITRDVTENAHLFEVINGFSKDDYTSADVEKFEAKDLKLNKKLKVAVPKFCVGENINDEVLSVFLPTLEKIKKMGHQVDYVEIPFLKYSIPLYQVIALAEASSNLARFDGLKYGYSPNQYDNFDDFVTKSRSVGFGAEVKRRMMVGTYVLSSENVDIYYKKALQVRQELTNELNSVYKNYDIILSPATPTAAFPLGEKRKPNEAFFDDLLTIPFNMSGHPSLSMPIGKCGIKPIGMQVSSNYFEEKKIYSFAIELEKELGV